MLLLSNAGDTLNEILEMDLGPEVDNRIRKVMFDALPPQAQYAFEVVCARWADPEPMTTSIPDVARKFRCPRNSVSKLLLLLKRHGFVHRHGRDIPGARAHQYYPDVTWYFWWVKNVQQKAAA